MASSVLRLAQFSLKVMDDCFMTDYKKPEVGTQTKRKRSSL